LAKRSEAQHSKGKAGGAQRSEAWRSAAKRSGAQPSKTKLAGRSISQHSTAKPSEANDAKYQEKWCVGKPLQDLCT